jgi:hypothetical protein
VPPTSNTSQPFELIASIPQQPHLFTLNAVAVRVVANRPLKFPKRVAFKCGSHAVSDVVNFRRLPLEAAVGPGESSVGFSYEVAVNGRVAIIGLTDEETLEFELLYRSQRPRPATKGARRLSELASKHRRSVIDRTKKAGTFPMPNAIETRVFRELTIPDYQEAANLQPRKALIFTLAVIGVFAVPMILLAVW